VIRNPLRYLSRKPFCSSPLTLQVCMLSSSVCRRPRHLSVPGDDGRLLFRWGFHPSVSVYLKFSCCRGSDLVFLAVGLILTATADCWDWSYCRPLDLVGTIIIIIEPPSPWLRFCFDAGFFSALWWETPLGYLPSVLHTLRPCYTSCSPKCVCSPLASGHQHAITSSS
jgi:hypothetical protein